MHDAAAEAETIEKKIVYALNDTYRIGNINHHNSVSIGATMFVGNKTPIEDIRKQSDWAMYRARNCPSGRGVTRRFGFKKTNNSGERKHEIFRRQSGETDVQRSGAANDTYLGTRNTEDHHLGYPWWHGARR